MPTQLDPANPDIQKIYTNSVDAPNNGLLDNYNFNENYNSGYPFHGGVSYGTFPGTNTNLGTVSQSLQILKSKLIRGARLLS